MSATATPDASTGIVLPRTSARAERLDQLGAAGRLAAFEAAGMSAADVATWYARYPEEVPTINGEFPWIAATLE